MPLPVPAPVGAGPGSAPQGGAPAAPPIPGPGAPAAPAGGAIRRFGFDKVAVRAIIAKRFRVYEERDALPGLDQAVLVAFFVLADRETVQREYPGLQADLKALDPQIMPVLREESGETVIVVTRRPEVAGRAPRRLAAGLALATVLTLTLAGSVAWSAYDGNSKLSELFAPTYLGLGFLGFAVPFLFIFTVQEIVRRVVARRYGVTLGIPFLVPVPPFVFIPTIGTFGSVIHTREPFPDRRALFDIAAAGPIAGFIAALPVVIVGILLTSLVGTPIPDGGDVELGVMAPNGETWTEGKPGPLSLFERSEPTERQLTRAHNVTVTFSRLVAGYDFGAGAWNVTATGTGATGDPLDLRLNATALDADGRPLAWNQTRAKVGPGERHALLFALPSGAHRLNVTLEYRVPDPTTYPIAFPLAYQGLESLFGTEDDVIMHPVALAGWSAVLMIGIILVPAGRLDGGGIARALLGERMSILAYISLGALAVLSFVYQGWVYLVLFVILFLGARHPAPINETTPLLARQKVMAVLLLLLLVVSFVPIPAQLPGT